jgi:outer membrane biosynthesis protein TonB
MLSNNEQKERKSRIAAIVGTLLFHALMLVVLLLLAFHTPLPLPGEEGVEVNLGYSDEGMGDIQPDEPALAPNTAPPPAKTKADDQVVTENTEEAPAIVKVNKKAEKPSPTPVKKTAPVAEPPKEPTVNQKAMYPGKSTKTVAGGNQGTTGKPGDQGKPDGTPGSPNYDGTGGKGNGSSFDLGGRGTRGGLVPPVYNSPEQGRIVVSIKVNREGKVTYAVAINKGSTITEINLRQQAEIAARKTLFQSDANAPEEQRGTITYVFVKQK